MQSSSFPLPASDRNDAAQEASAVAMDRILGREAISARRKLSSVLHQSAVNIANCASCPTQGSSAVVNCDDSQETIPLGALPGHTLVKAYTGDVYWMAFAEEPASQQEDDLESWYGFSDEPDDHGMAISDDGTDAAALPKTRPAACHDENDTVGDQDANATRPFRAEMRPSPQGDTRTISTAISTLPANPTLYDIDALLFVLLPSHTDRFILPIQAAECGTLSLPCRTMSADIANHHTNKNWEAAIKSGSALPSRKPAAEEYELEGTFRTFVDDRRLHKAPEDLGPPMKRRRLPYGCLDLYRP